ncbi:2Fe-2S iron-sulfur cluster-binding protein [Xanthomonas sp. NCPPB 1638]|uniref:Oxidoreductase n=1 Tax=Xanthomonas cucurbitae TaxID=56453 RepID=A0A2S7DTL8_9XANT|nr:PDR/VanB family oxidoreductase [Xanthomonas cucurbitae]PPU77120.1 oxidoreductase [Xanthomonas cucurbitae]QHG85895.1 oxidoreductase [Xanthomonas cucurbitae]WDM75798.1 PDR/VanB family oxidoreductase [Xanthomonas cucurbitae]WDM79504.1 PDR/VanB family oxidoreductase [Xanthomonas cucurbitae]WDM83193.1 PDR/VanB family oxidoreductase [Xanthomonas cucurbitae]
MRKDTQWHRARVVRIADLCEGVREIVFDPGPAARSFAVGSHLDFRVELQGRADVRSYSLVGEPRADGHYCIAVRQMPESRGGSRYMWTLQPGDAVEMSPPSNNFALDERGEHILLIAGGIGITPIVGMAQRLAARHPAFRLLYVGRSRHAMAYVDELHALLGERLQLHCDDSAGPPDLTGELARLPPNGEVYVCGPLGMLEAVREHWHVAGRPRARLHFETFGNSGRVPAQAFVVKLPGLGLEVPVAENQSMLDALNDAGVELIAECRRGECGLCAVDILDSAADIDHRDVFFSDAQRRENRKLCACVSRAVGGSVSIDTGYRRELG